MVNIALYIHQPFMHAYMFRIAVLSQLIDGIDERAQFSAHCYRTSRNGAMLLISFIAHAQDGLEDVAEGYLVPLLH